jgi:drug/metabolite transporter (DMT)-like permease
MRGIALVLVAVMLFAIMDTAAKYLIGQFGVPLVSSIRYGMNLILLAVFLIPRHGRKLWQTQRTGLVMLRGAALAVATLFAGLALQRMPVGETIAIIYLQGSGIMIAAGLFLRERVSAFGWIAAATGFAGVLLIARPGGALDPIGVALALACAAISVVYILLSRALAPTESTMSLLFHVAVAGLLLFGLLLPFTWRDVSMTRLDVLLLAFIGTASLAGHYLLTSAYRFAPASMLAPFNYVHIAMATLFGAIVYQHVPDGWALTGMAMIGVSGAAVALYTHLTRRVAQR